MDTSNSSKFDVYVFFHSMSVCCSTTMDMVFPSQHRMERFGFLTRSVHSYFQDLLELYVVYATWDKKKTAFTASLMRKM